ncbi:HWE histidine kinase domain-containing protein [Afifella sp. IM 167]|uniref:sensor histidine kinase n=1 Tax=Afifella sp. IM 167 TaxID=2033586 RepID=UPI001CCFD200
MTTPPRDNAQRDKAGKAVGVSHVAKAALWERCSKVLRGSQISLFSQDADGLFNWVFNAPEGLSPSAILGKGDADVFPAETVESVVAAKHEARKTGELQQLEISLPLDPDTPRWYDMLLVPEFGEDGTVAATIGAFIDITERKIQEEHLRIVMRELAHRSKNLLAVIQGIARQTAENASSTDQFVSRFNGRIFSLSRAHDVLTEADWRGARIFDLVRSQIALYAETRLSQVELSGVNGFLRPNAAQYLGLALHELTTNAIKYGALGSDEGRVEVAFEKVEGDHGRYRFSWCERNGPPVKQPKAKSFGVVMLCEVVPTTVGGAADLEFEQDGLCYELTLARTQLIS